MLILKVSEPRRMTFINSGVKIIEWASDMKITTIGIDLAKEVLQTHFITEADETYILESNKGKRNLGRKARKRGGSVTQRGISTEQVCVLVARDRSGQTLDFVIGNGPLTKKLLGAALKPTLDTDALLVSDANPTYKTFCMTEGISHEVVNLSQGQRVRGAYHVQNANA